MSVTFGFITFIGVELKEPDGLVSIEEQEFAGCVHEEKVNNFCPECGAPAKKVVSVNVNKVPLNDDWQYLEGEKIVNDRYYVHTHEGKIKKRYVGVFFKRCYIEDFSMIVLGKHETEKYLSECEELITYLEDHYVEITSGPNVYTFPYVSL